MRIGCSSHDSGWGFSGTEDDLALDRTAKSEWLDWEIEESIRTGQQVLGVYPQDWRPKSFPNTIKGHKIKYVPSLNSQVLSPDEQTAAIQELNRTISSDPSGLKLRPTGHLHAATMSRCAPRWRAVSCPWRGWGWFQWQGSRARAISRSSAACWSVLTGAETVRKLTTTSVA
ncbi:MAG: TIR domain-containing protein [Nitrospirota bacterium]|nr:TIR domain-containing protein [Nitrospirota bacterium]